MTRRSERNRTDTSVPGADLWWQTPPASPDLRQGLSSGQVATLLGNWAPTVLHLLGEHAHVY